jgi:hypothetical protein
MGQRVFEWVTPPLVTGFFHKEGTRSARGDENQETGAGEGG